MTTYFLCLFVLISLARIGIEATLFTGPRRSTLMSPSSLARLPANDPLPALFDRPGQALPCPENLHEALESLSRGWPRDRLGANPFANTGARYDSAAFSAHAYDWSGAPQPWNFRWGTLRVSWYKELGREMTINRLLSPQEVEQLCTECASDLATS